VNVNNSEPKNGLVTLRCFQKHGYCKLLKTSMFYEFLIFLMSIFHFSILCQNSFKTVIFTENSKSIGPVAALPVKFQMAGILVMKPKRIALHYLRTVRSCVSFGTGVIAPGFF
jgi:hypothetical protein